MTGEVMDGPPAPCVYFNHVAQKQRAHKSGNCLIGNTGVLHDHGLNGYAAARDPAHAQVTAVGVGCKIDIVHLGAGRNGRKRQSIINGINGAAQLLILIGIVEHTAKTTQIILGKNHNIALAHQVLYLGPRKSGAQWP